MHTRLIQGGLNGQYPTPRGQNLYALMVGNAISKARKALYRLMRTFGLDRATIQDEMIDRLLRPPDTKNFSLSRCAMRVIVRMIEN